MSKKTESLNEERAGPTHSREIAVRSMICEPVVQNTDQTPCSTCRRRRERPRALDEHAMHPTRGLLQALSVLRLPPEVLPMTQAQQAYTDN